MLKSWKKEDITIAQLHKELLLQAASLQLMGERLQRIEDTTRYLMECHYYYGNLGKDQTEETVKD